MSQKQQNFRSLSITLAITFAALSLVTLTVNGGLNTYFSYRGQRQAIANDQQIAASKAANTVKGFMDNKLTTLTIASKLDNLASVDAKSQKLVLDKLLGYEPSFTHTSILDTRGLVVQESSRLSSYRQVAEKDTEGILTQTGAGNNYIGNIHIDSATSEPLVTLASPIKDKFGDYQGTLTAEVNLKFMWDLVSKIKIGANGQAYVVDKKGNLLAYGDTTRVLAHENLSKLFEVSEFIKSDNLSGQADLSTSKGINGSSVAATHVALQTPDWAVVIEEPVFEAFAPVFKNLISTAVLDLISITLIVWASFYLSKRISKPLSSLRDLVNKIGEGNLDIKADTKSRNEIGELGLAFNKMADNLKDSNKRLHEEHARLTASINSLEVGFFMTDLSDNIVIINDSARTLLANSEVTPEIDWNYKHVADLLKGSIDLMAIVKSCKETGHVMNIKEVNFNNKVLSLFAGPILSHSENNKTAVIGTVVLLEDITEIIVQARSKDEFFSIASHELRTPLTTIRGNSSMILQMYEDVLKDPSLKGMVEDIHGSSNRLIEIVNDFLDVSRIEQGKMKYTLAEVKLDKIIEKIVYEMKAVLKEKNLSLDIEHKTLGNLPTVIADSDRVQQIIYNLIGNAVKFTEKGGVKVAAFQDGTMVKVTITDTGRGIAPEGQRMLFRKFQQAGSSLLTRDTTKGTGLGLYISKLLVEGMGGEVALESSVEGKGSVFSFTLPVASSITIADIRTETSRETREIDIDTGLTKKK